MVPNLEKLRPIVVDDLVRIGRDNDGGYVVSERTTRGCSALIGLGINTDWSFEADFLSRSPETALLAVDGSISPERFLRGALGHRGRAAALCAKGRIGEAREEWMASREMASLRADFRAFFSRPNRQFVDRMISDANGWTGMSWADVVRNTRRLEQNREPRWFVKMDIEGAEYRVIPEMLASADAILGIAIEFHDCDLMAERLDGVIDQLNEHFAIVHVHGNNHAPLVDGSRCPRVLEVSLMNRALATSAELARPNTRRYPLENLDQPNRAGAEDYVFL